MDRDSAASCSSWRARAQASTLQSWLNPPGPGPLLSGPGPARPACGSKPIEVEGAHFSWGLPVLARLLYQLRLGFLVSRGMTEQQTLPG